MNKEKLEIAKEIGREEGRQEIYDQLQVIFADPKIAENYWAVRNRINDLFLTPPKGGE